MVIQLKAPKNVITVTADLFFFKLPFGKVNSELFCCCFELWLRKTSLTFEVMHCTAIPGVRLQVFVFHSSEI